MLKQYTFTIPNLPKRFINAITAELSMFHYGHHSILQCCGHEMSAPIPAWLIIAWIEDGSIMRVPNLGKTTINQVLDLIHAQLKIEKQIVLPFKQS